LSELEGGGQRFRLWAVALGPIAFALVLLVRPAGLEGAPLKTLAATAWVATWWIFESLPIAATSLLPLILLPLLGVKSAGETAALYVEDLLFLLLGGFLLALALERWGLHRRFAIAVLSLLGGDPRRLVFGFCFAAALVSMWISNSGTTLVLLPIALAVGRRLAGGLEAGDQRRVEQSLLLAVAYGATAGGLGTYVGTPPNLVFRERYVRDFGAGTPGGPPEISFLQWMLAFAPLALLLAAGIGFVLSRGLPRAVDRGAHGDVSTREIVRRERAALPPWSAGERMVAAIFALAALLWITREPLDVGGHVLFGWSRLFAAKNWVSDGTVAITLCVLCFLLRARPLPDMKPSGPPSQARTVPLLDWGEAEAKMPWGILLLFGGGFAIGDAFRSSGLSNVLGQSLAHALEGLPGPCVVLGVALFVILITEFMNNTACAQVLLPILSAVAPRLHITPAALLVPATLASSCGFMMPAGTAPNAIVFATRRVAMGTMVRVGLLLDVGSALLVTAWIVWVALPIFGLRLGTLP
jgi:sodium-dependent dicarboxylate transporter 2/3/5